LTVFGFAPLPTLDQTGVRQSRAEPIMMHLVNFDHSSSPLSLNTNQKQIPANRPLSPPLL
jgi:hypothetical protein